MNSGGPTQQAVILVGGLGTRLGQLTQTCPKPLMDIQGEPFLGRLMDNLRRYGFNDFVLLAGYLADQLAEFARQYADRHFVSVRLSIEEHPAGTAGALKLAEDLLEDEFLLLNGDTMFNFNVLDLAVRPVDFDWIGRVALRHVDDTSRYGLVRHDAGRVVSMCEKITGSGPGFINAGVYWFSKLITGRVSSLPCSLESDVLPQLIAEGALAGFAYEGAFIDIGIPDDLYRAQHSWDSYVARSAVFFDRDGVLNHDIGYTHRPEEFNWTAEAITTIKTCNDADRFVFVVTNQAGIARGYYGEEAVRHLHEWMNAELRVHGAHIDAFAYCPHHPEGIIPSLAVGCGCRKPEPGMIQQLMLEWPVQSRGSFLVGDKMSDVAAAQAAGIEGYVVANGGDNLQKLVLDLIHESNKI